MVVQVIAAMPPFLAAAKNKDDIGTFPFPAADSADALKIPAGVDAGIAASAKGKHLAEAKKFIEWLGRPENMASFSKATYSIPLVGADPAKTDALLKPFAPFMAANKTVPFMDQQWPNAKVQPAHFAGVQDLVAGKTDVGGLLEQARRGVQAEVIAWSTTHARTELIGEGGGASRPPPPPAPGRSERRRCGSQRRR